ncbi:MAG: tetratricopeptide repeat protein [Cyanobacteria bacterium J06641_2]
MESFLKHTLIFIIVSLLTFFSHSFVPITQTGFVAATQNGVDASGLMQEGKKLYEGGNFRDAVTAWKKAFRAYQQQQDKVNQALALNNLSLTYQESGQWKDAEVVISRALDIVRSVPEKQNNYARSNAYAQVLDTKGHLEYVQGQTQKALDIWKQAAQIYNKLNDNEGILINKINQAQALQSLGSLRQAKDILNQLEESLPNQKSSALKITGLRSLANTYALLGDFNKSKYILHKELKQYQKLHNIKINKEQESNILVSLGNTQRALANQARERREAKSYNEYQECKKYEIFKDKKLTDEAIKANNPKPY